MTATPRGMFNKVAYRVVVTEGQSASGALTKNEAPTDAMAGIPCAFQSTGTSDALVYDRERMVQAQTLFVPIGTTLAFNDRVSVGGSTYRVLGNPQDEAGRGSFLKVFVELEV